MRSSKFIPNIYNLVDYSAARPRPRFMWRPVPRWALPIVKLYAAFLWAFDSYVPVRTLNVKLGTDYEGFFIRIFAGSTGRWYIKLGS